MSGLKPVACETQAEAGKKGKSAALMIVQTDADESFGVTVSYDILTRGETTIFGFPKTSNAHTIQGIVFYFEK